MSGKAMVQCVDVVARPPSAVLGVGVVCGLGGAERHLPTGGGGCASVSSLLQHLGGVREMLVARNRGRQEIKVAAQKSKLGQCGRERSI